MTTMHGSPRTATARRSRIAEILSDTPVTSQEELGQLLDAEGVHVTQATLSRDLLALGAVKDAEGTYVLSVPESPESLHGRATQEGSLGRVVGELLVRADAAGNIAVVRTPPGAAQFLAGHLDRSSAFDTVGTVAGDDTIIIVMRTEDDAQELCQALVRMAEQRRAV